jgi:cytoskeleton protein RodZ
MSDSIDAATAGTLLRRAREDAGLHVASLAVSLKVPVRKLEALEQDRYDQLTDAVFARALASSVCRTLKIDPQPVLDRLPQTHAPRLAHDHEGLNAPFRAPGDAAAPGWADQLTKPAYLGVFALLLGALILVFLPTVRTSDAAVAKSGPGAAALGAPVLPPGGVTDGPVAASPDSVPVPVESGSAAGATMVPVVALTAEPHGASGDPVKAAVAAQPAASAALPAASATRVVAPAAAASAPAPNSTVVFRTTGPSWIEVTDARGAVAMRRLMAAGESAGASGNLPLTVTVGSVTATSVQVRGKPFDLSRVSRDNVARFEVK